ncbi:peptide chain release factor 2 [Patescibacteria group bacterium]|nr:peptide chain release factor 2 [Patescibacteria group bacterium]
MDQDTLIANCRKLLLDSKLIEKKAEIGIIEKESEREDFWQTEDSRTKMQLLSALQKEVKSLEILEKLCDDLEAAIELELSEDSERIAKNLEKIFKEAELKQYLSGKYDRSHAILSIHPGQGGTEAMDWAEMMKRMYQRYFERKGWKYRFVSEIRGEDAGIKEAVFEIEEEYAYGYLKGEQGTHRLVRQSPFNADSLRQTSFALVEVLPLLDQQNDIEIKDSDLEWNFTRAGGAGGQSVNKTSSAVELTHVPSNITVKCREERSQIQNRERALKMLKAKLAKIEEERLENELQSAKGQHQNASWGTQIRNYVLHPYQLVKDTRTQVETSQSSSVLDGDLDQFVLSFIHYGKN